jgi:PST family polysaccharide transporter
VIQRDPAKPSSGDSRRAARDQLFETGHLRKDLGGKAVRSGAITVMSKGLEFILGLGSTVVLARLLTPEHFGTMAMALIVLQFVMLFLQSGLSMATVQRPNISEKQISALFWVNAALGVLLCGVVAAAAYPAARIFDTPELAVIFFALAAQPLIGGFGVQHLALLRRQMRFGVIAVIEVAAASVSIVAAIVLAAMDFGVWALVAMRLSAELLRNVGFWFACPWRPGRFRRSAGVRTMLRFGRDVTAHGLLHNLAARVDLIVIGYFWGSHWLGLYDRSQRVFLLPLRQMLGPISMVAIPALSRLQDTPGKYRQSYLQILDKVLLMTMPLCAFIVGTSEWLVWIVLGPQWTEANLVFTLFGVAALFVPLGNTCGYLYITQDRTGEMLRWGLCDSGIKVVGVLAGAPFGPVGLAAAHAVRTFVSSVLAVWVVGRRGPVKPWDIYRSAIPFYSAAGLAILLVRLMRQFRPDMDPIPGLAAAMALVVLTFGLVLALLPSGRATLRDTYKMMTLLRKGNVNQLTEPD